MKKRRTKKDLSLTLTPNSSLRNPLRKAEKDFKASIETGRLIRQRTGIWTRSEEEKAKCFGYHLSEVFQNNAAMNNFTIPLLSHYATRTIPDVNTTSSEINSKNIKYQKVGRSQPQMLIELQISQIQHGKDATLPSSHRPISLLPVFEKVLLPNISPFLPECETIPKPSIWFSRKTWFFRASSSHHQ